MLAEPSVRATVSSKECVIPGSPAVPRNSAYSDQASAARVPREMRVSMVEAPWRRLVHAALWNGQAPHTTTGAARVSDSHCQWVNCSAGTIATAMTGALRTAETTSRCRRPRTWSSGAGPFARSASVPACGGGGSSAVYPVFSTVAMRSAGVRSPPKLTRAFSVA